MAHFIPLIKENDEIIHINPDHVELVKPSKRKEILIICLTSGNEVEVRLSSTLVEMLSGADTSDMPEVGRAWFERATVVVPDSGSGSEPQG